MDLWLIFVAIVVSGIVAIVWIADTISGRRRTKMTVDERRAADAEAAARNTGCILFVLVAILALVVLSALFGLSLSL